MGKIGSICHFPRALPAGIWGHCSQILVFTSIWGTLKGCSNDTFRAVFPSIWVSWDPQTLQNKGKRKMTNRPVLPPTCIPSQNSEVMDVLLNFYSKVLKQNCEHSAKAANSSPKIANKQN